MGAAVLLVVGTPRFASGETLSNRSLEEDSLAAVSGASDSLFLNPSLARDSLEVERASDSVAIVGVASDSIASFPSPRVRAWQVGLLRGDRMEHASLSFALTSALIIVTRNRAASAATAFAFGIGKELWDRRTGAFDPVDLTADAMGVGLATVLVAPRGP